MNNGKRWRKLTVPGIVCLSLLTAGCSFRHVALSPSIQPQPSKLVLVYPGTKVPKDLPLVQAEMSRYLQRKINTVIELRVIEWNAWADKSKMMKAAGEPFDLMFTAGWDNYADSVYKGQFTPLNELLQLYGQGITEALGSDFMRASQINGRNYAVPTVKEFAQSYGLLLRKDLSDAYKFDNTGIKSLNELEVMLRTLKSNEPGLSPLVGSRFANALLASRYDVLAGNIGIAYRNSTPRVINITEDAEYADIMRRMHKWYQEGLIHKDAGTMEEDQSWYLIRSGKGAAIGSPLKPGKDKEMSVSLGIDLVQFAISPPITTSVEATGAMLAISRNSSNKEAAMRFLNLLYTDPALLNLLDWGIEGKHYVKISDNRIRYPEGVRASDIGYSNNAWMFGNQKLAYLWENEDPQKWLHYDRFNETAFRSAALGFFFNLEPVKTELANLAVVDREYQKGLYSGTINPDRILPLYIKQQKEAGIDKVVAEMQKQLDAWMLEKPPNER
ncbi:ABC transporter substrate-binding protein [Paenibacillus sp. GCM10027628]|uniref:ABC transporter substrate-binding protein n=1 Tax=Paenibacillus sp. GCM10027628 TaxID=3273413 RepID=UPI0036420CB5